MVKVKRQAADLSPVRRRNRHYGSLCLLVCACVAALAAPSATAKQSATKSWAQPQIKEVVAHGLMAPSVASFHANDPLTQTEMNELLPVLPSELTTGPDTSTDPTD